MDQKLLKKILAGSKNINFDDFVKLVIGFGFVQDRVHESHNIFKKEGIKELVNIQNVSGEVKPYQIKQFLSIIEKYNLTLLG
ncbi:MAG: type II toxin-antitoxin system HicA family toxin [Candidatus Kapabacteria bacterium]|nr:type II toxin-antitoxin system HicA family toxin [Candidatus Kapabacteria bacterium]